MPYRVDISTYDMVNDIFLSRPDLATFGSYTVDEDYVSTTDLNGYKYLKEGWVVALDPSTGLIVPNYTSYGFGVLGALPAPVSLENASGEHDQETGVVLDGAWLDEDLCFDNGVFGTVLAATKTALSGRIVFTTTIS